MPDLFLPHTVSHEVASQGEDAAGRATVVTYATAVSRKCMRAPLAQTKAYDEYGIETSNPYLFVVPIDDAGLYSIGDRLTVGTDVFIIVTDTRKFDIGTPADNGSFIANRED